MIVANPSPVLLARSIGWSILSQKQNLSSKSTFSFAAQVLRFAPFSIFAVFVICKSEPGNEERVSENELTST